MSVNLIYRHTGDGKFVAEMEDGSFKDLGPKAVGMIRYTYFEDYQLPDVGWEVTSGKLLADYQPKMLKDYQDGKFEISHTDENGVNHYKEKEVSHIDDEGVKHFKEKEAPEAEEIEVKQNKEK
jgi:hypothetical protein